MKFIVVGCGSIGRRHIGNLLNLGHDVVAWNRGPDRRSRVIHEFGIDVYEDFDLVLAGGADAAFVCTPSSYHPLHALAIVRAGMDLFVEKPLASSTDMLDQLEAEICRAGTIAHVGCNMRFHFGPKTVKKLIDEGQIGKPLWASVWGGMHLPDWHPDEDYRDMYSSKRSLGGGVILDFIHEIDLIRWLFGDPHRVVSLVSSSGSLDIETEDVADAIFGYAGGLQVNLHLDYLQRPFQRGIRVVGQRGWVEWDLARGAVEWYNHETRGLEDIPFPDSWSHNDMYMDQTREFIGQIVDREPLYNGIVDGRKALELAIRVKESSPG